MPVYKSQRWFLTNYCKVDVSVTKAQSESLGGQHSGHLRAPAPSQPVLGPLPSADLLVLLQEARYVRQVL